MKFNLIIDGINSDESALIRKNVGFEHTNVYDSCFIVSRHLKNGHIKINKNSFRNLVKGYLVFRDNNSGLKEVINFFYINYR